MQEYPLPEPEDPQENDRTSIQLMPSTDTNLWNIIYIFILDIRDLSESDDDKGVCIYIAGGRDYYG